MIEPPVGVVTGDPGVGSVTGDPGVGSVTGESTASGGDRHV